MPKKGLRRASFRLGTPFDVPQGFAALKQRRSESTCGVISELIRRIPLLHKAEVIDMSIAQYCEAAKIRFDTCNDFQSQRQFVLEHIEKVVYWNDKLELYGSVPIKTDSEQQETCIEFCIKDAIVRVRKMGRRERLLDEAV